MKHSPRIRKTLKWTSAAMVVVLVVAWVCSLYPRIRKTLKWTSAAMVVVLVIAWAGSLKWYLRSCIGRLEALVYPHAVVVTLLAPGATDFDEPRVVAYPWAFVRLQERSFRSNLWSVQNHDYIRPHAVVPFWPLMALCGGVFALLHRRDRRSARVEQGRCVNCGYDRAGIAVTAACPECGDMPRG